jgi:aminocarboxymuconate-semialdehyde decarboxylase
MARSPKKRSYTIDFHAHMVLPEAVAFAAKHGMVPEVAKMARAKLIPIGKARQRGNFPLSKIKAKDKAAAVAVRMVDPKLQIKDMDDRGVDINVLTASLVHQCTYNGDPVKALEIERKTNDRMAEFVAYDPDRFVGLGSVPLQDTRKAVKELERCMGELGLRGVQISSMAGKRELGDAKLDPFWAKAEELKATIFIHPAGLTGPRYQNHQLWNSIGQPLEETMAMSSLIHEGVMDKFPKLKICVAHGGGYLPFYAGRADRNYKDKPHTRGPMTKSPSQYLKQFYYESCLYNVDMLEYLIGKVGPNRIVMGSDYPVGESDPVGFIRNSRKISKENKEKILWKNAARILGLRL